MAEALIRKYSHYFTVLAYTPAARMALHEILLKFVQKDFKRVRGKFRPVPKRVYARKCDLTNIRALHISFFDEFIKELNWMGLRGTDLEIEEVPLYEPMPCKFKIKDFSPWEEQADLVDFIVSPGTRKCITLQPGGGKTLISLFAAERLGTRFAVVTQGGYAERWVPEFYKVMGLKPEEVRVCRGVIALLKLFKEVNTRSYRKVKALFISVTTIRDYIKEYSRENNLLGKNIPHPSKLYEFLGVGFRILDEAHKDFHANFIADLYTHIPKSVYLTATLLSRDPFILRMYELMMPSKLRRDSGKLNIYVEVIQVNYYLKDANKVKYLNHQGQYSEIAYEYFLMDNELRMRKLAGKLADYISKTWADERIPGDRIIFWVGLIDFADKLVELLREYLPDLRINRFTSEDDYSIVEETDFIVSTLGKSGTALDIPNLVRCYMFTAVDSPNANVQAFGRLREFKKRDDVVCQFHFFVCHDIPKQVDYSHTKRSLLKPRAAKYLSDCMGTIG